MGVFEVLGVVVIFSFLKWGCRKWNRSWFCGTDLAYLFHPFWADTHADFTVRELTYYQIINDTVGKFLGLVNQLLLNCWGHYFFWIRTFDSLCPGIRTEVDRIGMVLSIGTLLLSSSIVIKHFKRTVELALCPEKVNSAWITYKGNPFLPKESCFLIVDNKVWQSWL